MAGAGVQSRGLGWAWLGTGCGLLRTEFGDRGQAKWGGGPGVLLILEPSSLPSIWCV